jgi:hypothetical protein
MFEVQNVQASFAGHEREQAECMLGVALAAAGRHGEALGHLRQGCAALDSTGIEDPLITRWGRAALKSAGG